MPDLTTRDSVIGWHFAADTLRDGSPLPKAGDVLPPIEDPEPCVRGYHASERAIDALQYAPGAMVARVELRGVVLPHGNPIDKYVASNRAALSEYVDVEATLLAFARHCALDVAHLWDMPDMTRRYLESGDEDLRDAAGNAAWAATEATARANAWAAARAAAEAAARAAGAAAARGASWAAARAAAESAARGAARNAAWAAAWGAAEAAQNTRLETMLTEAINA